MGTFGFTGELQDGASNMLYLRARWYDPGQRTFTSRDPFAGFAETPYSLHPYQYAYSNPALWTDPSGLYSSSPVEHMIQVYYEQSGFRLKPGIVVPEFSIYLGSKTGLLLNPGGRLTGEPSGNAGYIDILDVMLDKNIGYAYEIKPLGSPNSNKFSSVVARAEIERYVKLYNALPAGHQKSPYHLALEPRVMKLGHLFPSSWQIIGSNPDNPRAAILARKSQNGVI
ncbi:MAG: RHS repeat-associated core domain-containing protein, partial [Chloroflexales bacterium]|nr:RHS repeat-associated core domain-containing protein [Chloroflexales bacterium]